MSRIIILLSILVLAPAAFAQRTGPDQWCRKVVVPRVGLIYACEDCVETDSGGCVGYDGTCFMERTPGSFTVTGCAPATCGWPPEGCFRLASGASAFQSFEGDDTRCGNGSHLVCRSTRWETVR